MSVAEAAAQQYKPEAHRLITVQLGRQTLGIPLHSIHSILNACPIMRVPLAPPEIVGLIPLQGRVATVVDPRPCLGLPPLEREAPYGLVVVERMGEYYALKMDSVDDALTVPVSGVEALPPNLPLVWNAIATGVHRLNDRLLVLIDVQALLLQVRR